MDIHSSLFDPKRAHIIYNDFMDELEYAAQCDFDAIGVMGNSLALYNPPTRAAEEFAMIDVISGGRLIAGFPVGTPMEASLRADIPAFMPKLAAE